MDYVQWGDVSATQETSVPKVHGDPAVVEEIDCRDLNDPHHDRQLRDHIGRHPMVIGGILSSCKQKLLTHLRKARVAVERGNGRAIIIFQCKSARHRSVSAATMCFLCTCLAFQSVFIMQGHIHGAT